MPHDSLPWEIDDRGVVRVTFNRPEASNALDPEMLAAFDEALERCAGDGALRLLQLAANGKNFCAGADIKRMGGHGASALPTVLGKLEGLRIPSMAVVQGACVGAGAAIAACCDMVVAAEDAFFSIPEVRIGMPPTGVVRYLIPAIGVRRARRYAMTGERITAGDAERFGLVHDVVGRDALEAAAGRLREAILAGGPGAMALTKQAVRLLAPVPDQAWLDAQLREEMQAHAASGEAEEGRAAFGARRPPKWA